MTANNTRKCHCDNLPQNTRIDIVQSDIITVTEANGTMGTFICLTIIVRRLHNREIIVNIPIT